VPFLLYATEFYLLAFIKTTPTERCRMTILDNITTLFVFYSSIKPVAITKIQGDASSRQYFRVAGARGSLIACYDPVFEASSPGSYTFLLMHELLFRHSISVPDIKAIDAEHGLLLLEDCGELLLQDIFSLPEEQTLPDRYREIIDLLIRLQSIKGDDTEIPFSMSFDRDKLMVEFDFFIEHALCDYFAPVFNKRSLSAIRHEFEAVAEILVKPQHFVLNHRDFHSRNILIHQNRPVIIDFQDARMGLPQYDAVSLIKDSYVKLDQVLAEELKAYHYHALRSHNLCAMSFDEYLYYFDIMAFQRNIKAIGTFAYQTRVKKNSAFEHSIAPTLAYLPDYINARSELSAVGELLKPLLDGLAS
jgi:aminoglycoside/choline kinase family phosphotransferase